MKFLLLILAFACSHPSSLKEGDRRLKKDSIPSFLTKYLNQNLDDLAFYEKVTAGVTVYEVKYEIEEDDEDQEVSITYDAKGNFLEKEVDLKFSSLNSFLQDKIKSYLKANYPRAKIYEAERRTDRNQKEFFDIEIRHESSSSGFWELSFDQDGNFVSCEVEHYQPIETLN